MLKKFELDLPVVVKKEKQDDESSDSEQNANLFAGKEMTLKPSLVKF